MEITANALQTVTVNNNVLFTETPVPGNCTMIHREGSGIVTLKGATRQCRALFKATFSGNIAVPTDQTPDEISLAIALNGEAIDTTRMTVTPGAVEQFFNVSAPIYISVPACCCTQVSVKNISTIPVDVRNANLIIERVA